jgi:hypothetical protein
MKTHYSKLLTSLLGASLLCLLVIDFAEAQRRGGGGGHRGGGHSMSRGGPASSGSYQRSRVQPSSTPTRQSADRRNTHQNQRPDYSDQRQDNVDRRQDNVDNRQDNVSKGQDNRKEYKNDRKEYYDNRNEWYEDRWRRGAYLSVASWNRMNCRYTTSIVSGVTYYNCNGVRYERVYRGTQVTYIIVN